MVSVLEQLTKLREAEAAEEERQGAPLYAWARPIFDMVFKPLRHAEVFSRNMTSADFLPSLQVPLPLMTTMKIHDAEGNLGIREMRAKEQWAACLVAVFNHMVDGTDMAGKVPLVGGRRAPVTDRGRQPGRGIGRSGPGGASHRACGS